METTITTTTITTINAIINNRNHNNNTTHILPWEEGIPHLTRQRIPLIIIIISRSIILFFPLFLIPFLHLIHRRLIQRRIILFPLTNILPPTTFPHIILILILIILPLLLTPKRVCFSTPTCLGRTPTTRRFPRLRFPLFLRFLLLILRVTSFLLLPPLLSLHCPSSRRPTRWWRRFSPASPPTPPPPSPRAPTAWQVVAAEEREV